MKNEYEVYVEKISSALGNLVDMKPYGLEAMEVVIDYVSNGRKPTLKVTLYGSIEKLADRLHRPVRIENCVGRYYTKEIHWNNVIFEEVGVGRA